MSAVLAVKLLAAPALIGLASLAGRRWGPQVAGLLGGLPLVAGPVLVALWLSDGAGYAREIAHAAPAGVWANIVYMLAVGHGSRHLPWFLLIPLSWLAYLLVALLIERTGLAHSVVLGLGVIPALWLAARYGLPDSAGPVSKPPLPQVELLARMAAAALLVLGLTAAARGLGPTLTGLLAGAPVAAVVIPAFTLALAGRAALLQVLRGFLIGLMGFAVFFLLLAATMESLGAWAFLPALLGGLLTGALAAPGTRARPTVRA
ncbi:MAG TPA: hypothetical protein VFV11_07000 [Solimonas sp.]|nr:hypothetical protein [Solimonas sp.]